MCDFKNRTLSLKSFKLYNDNEVKEMERPSIATVLKCENEEMIEYYYEGRLTPDFTNAGIIQFDKQILIEVSNMCGNIDFTDEGRRIAEKVYGRHQILTEFLVSIGVSAKQAEEDACRIEHIISDETQQCIQNFLKKQS